MSFSFALKGMLRKEIRLLLWLITAGIPLSAVDFSFCSEFLKEVGVSLRGREALQHHIPVLHILFREKAISLLKTAETIAITMDG